MVYAGVNAGPKDVERGKNEHFRGYALGRRQKSAKPTIQEVSRDRLFASKDKAAYQRVLRLARPSAEGRQLGAAATGFADPPELAIFDVAGGEKTVGTRGVIQLEKEAEDVDIIQTGAEDYSVAYCDNHRVYLKTISASPDDEDPICIYTMPGAEAPGKPSLPVFRSLRFLTPSFIAVLINQPSRSGALLRVLRITPSASGPIARASQALLLPSRVVQATALSVCNLFAPETPGEAQANTQFLVAVADQSSISLVALDYQVSGANAIVTQPRLLTRIKDVHPLQITGLAFAPFPAMLAKARAPQVLRLASVSVGNTAVVLSVPLFKPTGAAHYRVAIAPVAQLGITPRQLVSVLAVLAFAALAQMILELSGMSPAVLRAEERLPAVLREYFTLRTPERGARRGRADERAGSGGAAMFAAFREHPVAEMIAELRGQGREVVVRASTPGSTDGGERLVSFNRDDEAAAQEAVSADIREKIEVAAREEGQGGPGGRSWEELGEGQRREWVRRLREVGQWAGELPETVFEGVVFGEAAGAVGRGVGGA